ncbi:MAG: hypoxanthine phosphoribosyltransferase [Planctomycetaceae bacterium]|nr:hypoxanthine phosphoribosyltransferase [Planctomycetaceae bacterium]
MRTLYSSAQIAERVRELGDELARVYAGRPLTVVGVLHGSVVLVADLIRAMPIPHQIAFVRASSYRGETTTGTNLQTSLEGLPDVAGRDVLLIDDIFDTGRTLSALAASINALGPASLRTAVLLWKVDRREVAATPDYYGFRIPDEFVIGYGLDYNGNYRNLPEIAVMEPGDL